ncbi:hypothetical protein EDD18DRAFT_1355219 [Armillaria luteobubalina]|uniref:Uncharacterized protein n=1 Tax=Armillaria luteobubalina TaxID=153913 RepID=A0AA39Q1E9_9AGAR|nr:hypothetical protein EDD18DRAFT_1355219 [Armillaria luteobubalina]
MSPNSYLHTSPRYIRHLQRLAESEGHYYSRQAVLYRTSPAFLTEKLQAEALNRPELVPIGAEVIRIDDYLKDKHFVASLLRHTIVNTLSRVALWQTVTVYIEDLAVLDNSVYHAAEKVRLMTCIEVLLNTGVYHLEKSIQKTVILTVDSVRDLFERKHEDSTFSQLRLRSKQTKPSLDTSSLDYALFAFVLLFGSRDAQEEHQARNYLARKFMKTKRLYVEDQRPTLPASHQMGPPFGISLHHLLRACLTSLLQDFSRKTDFARISLDLVARLPHNQRITSLDEKNRLLQEVVDNTPLESIVPTLGSLKDPATFKRVWNALDFAARRFGSRYSGIEDILGIELRYIDGVSRQRHADKRTSPQTRKPSDNFAIRNLVQPSSPAPVDSNICRVPLSCESVSSECSDTKAAATTHTEADINSQPNSIVTSSFQSTSRLETREVSPSVKDFKDDKYEDSFSGLFVGAISFGELLPTKKQRKRTLKSKKLSTSKPVPQWTYPIYVKRKTLATFELIFDSGAPGTLEYKDFERVMADLDFLIEPGGKGSKIFRPSGASTNKQPFMCDPPHHAKLGIDDTFRLRMRSDLQELYGWSKNSFALKPGRDPIDYFDID